MSAIVRLAQIRGLMFDIETEAGLTEISGLEREVLLACTFNKYQGVGAHKRWPVTPFLD